MATSPLFVPRRPGHTLLAPAPETGWLLLGGVGVAFAVIGAIDLALAWLPAGLGNPEWEFGTVSATLNGLPLPTLGLMMALAAALARGARRPARALAAVFGLLALFVLACAVLYALTVPIALGSTSNPVVAAGLRKAVTKGGALLLIYPLLYLWLAVVGWRHSSSPRHGARS